LFPEREKKTAEEAEAIRQGNRCSAAGIRAAENVLKAATVKAGKIIYEGRALTSERLKEEIEIACLRAGSVSSHTIAAGGDQACDPHCTGSGILRANELIIVDVFPRVVATGYHGDMTRTFLKGKASAEQKRLVETVLSAQKKAVESVKSGVTGDRIHREVVRQFEENGFKTDARARQPVGFFHGTGHGLGLEVHEAPRLSANGPRLKAGQVVTVEPGLYYPGLGGARIEDVVWVQKEGNELLSSYPYRWELA
jgi:Xaa-Pro aminopeptidase